MPEIQTSKFVIRSRRFVSCSISCLPGVQATLRIRSTPAATRVAGLRPFSYSYGLTSRLENRNELRQATIVCVAHRTVSVGIDPFRVLSAQIGMQLLLQLSVRANLTRFWCNARFLPRRLEFFRSRSPRPRERRSMLLSPALLPWRQ